jgi:predicted DNA-binding transcriptional regulator AlpA
MKIIRSSHAPDAQLLRINDVVALTTLSKSCINLWVAVGKFPKPMTLSPTLKAWRLKDVVAWIDEQYACSTPSTTSNEKPNLRAISD